MPRNVYSEIYLHITWHTKENARVVRGQLRERLYEYLRNRVVRTPGVVFHEMGGIEDHMHLAVTVPPTLLISEWIGELKGSSAHFINHQGPRRAMLAWQAGYGLVSFGKKDLPFVREYIRNQHEHHAAGRVFARLEATEIEEVAKGAN